MDRLRRSDFLDRLGGRVFLSQYQAMCALAPETVAQAMAAGSRPPGIAAGGAQGIGAAG